MDIISRPMVLDKPMLINNFKMMISLIKFAVQNL